MVQNVVWKIESNWKLWMFLRANETDAFQNYTKNTISIHIVDLSDIQHQNIS